MENTPTVLRTRRSLLRGMAAFAAGAIFAPSLRAAEYATVYPLGESGVMVWVNDYGPGLTCFAPHDDENTSVDAARRVLSQRGGALIQLVYGGQRNLRFQLERTYVADPNRIFSDNGIGATLTQYSRYSQEAHQLLSGLAQFILGTIRAVRPQGGMIVALHNNTDSSYSIASYGRGGSEEENAGRIYQNPQMDPDDFFFTTDPNLFNALQANNQNVVLQSNRPQNDGSLSVYCAQQGIPYVNVEGQDGHLNQQIAMIDLLAQLQG